MIDVSQPHSLGSYISSSLEKVWFLGQVFHNLPFCSLHICIFLTFYPKHHLKTENNIPFHLDASNEDICLGTCKKCFSVHVCSPHIHVMILWKGQCTWSNGYCTGLKIYMLNEQSCFKPWLGPMCFIIGKDTLFSHSLLPITDSVQ